MTLFLLGFCCGCLAMIALAVYIAWPKRISPAKPTNPAPLRTMPAYHDTEASGKPH